MLQECVACGTIYVDEKDASGWAHLVALPKTQNTTAGPSSSTVTVRNESSKKEKEKAILSNVSYPVFDKIPSDIS